MNSFLVYLRTLYGAFLSVHVYNGRLGYKAYLPDKKKKIGISFVLNK